VERIRPTLFFIVVAAGALLAACGGGASPAGFISSGAPLPELALQPEAVRVAVKPRALSFKGIGKSFLEKVVVSEKAYGGKFVAHSTCTGIAKASPTTGKGPKLTVKVTPLGTGTCSIAFVDAKKHKAKLSITVGTATTAPSASPTGNPTSSPTTSPTGPTPTPNAPAAIYVTYTASAAHPNVVAYDEQGNIKSSGAWSGAGSSPQSIVWAPGDLHWFYLTNGTTNTVKVYTSAGGQLSSFFSGPSPGPEAGAIAYQSVSPYYLYVASTGHHTIHAYDEDGNVITGVSFPATIDTTLGGIAYDANTSRIYVSNTSNGTVEYYSTTGTRGGSISAPCACSPGAIAFDTGNDRVYVWWNGTGGGMAAYDESGNAVSLTGGSGTPFSGLASPQAIAVDTHDGYLYVTDGASVKVFDASGNAIPTAGSFNPGFAATSANGITVNPPIH
jgi:hypothetical protein